MPELPEVETVRQGLRRLVKGKTIESVSVLWPKIIQTDLDLTQWKHDIIGEKIIDINRRGKYILFELTHYIMVSHLRMEGKYLFYGQDNPPAQIDKHTHVIFYFKDGSQLHYNDVRKFGRIELINKNECNNYFLKKKLGPEPLSEDFKLEEFSKRLERSQKNIKALLLDQTVVVGLGNIYVDEVLFRAGIHPERKASSLLENEIQLLFESIKIVLENAVKAGGTTIRTYKNALGEAGKFQLTLNVYGQTGQPCPKCGTEIMKIKVSQRGTHYCPNCQKMEVK